MSAPVNRKIINNTLFKDESGLVEEERTARAVAQTATGIGAGAVTVAGGASSAAIMSTLAGIGSSGGGAIAGSAVIALAPVAAARAIGYGVYKLFGGKRKRN